MCFQGLARGLTPQSEAHARFAATASDAPLPPSLTTAILPYPLFHMQPPLLLARRTHCGCKLPSSLMVTAPRISSGERRRSRPNAQPNTKFQRADRTLFSHSCAYTARKPTPPPPVGVQRHPDACSPHGAGRLSSVRRALRGEGVGLCPRRAFDAPASTCDCCAQVRPTPGFLTLPHSGRVDRLF